MPSVIASLPQNGRVAIVRLRSLGDCVLTTPAIQLLQGHRPDLRIATVVEDRFRDLFEDTLPPELSALRKFRPDLCLNLHGGTRSAFLAAFSGARYRAGFAHFRHQFAYNIHIPRAQEILHVDRKVHTAEHLASAIFYLGVPACEIPPSVLGGAGVFACPPRGQAKTPAPPTVLHPFASAADKTWPHFADLAHHLPHPLIIGGGDDDFAPFDAFPTLRGASLSEIKSLLASASLFIGNDSGPAHMAAAFSIPTVVLFGNSDPEIWGPWRTPSEILPLSSTVQDVLDALARLRVHA